MSRIVSVSRYFILSVGNILRMYKQGFFLFFSLIFSLSLSQQLRSIIILILCLWFQMFLYFLKYHSMFMEKNGLFNIKYHLKFLSAIKLFEKLVEEF